MSKPSENTAHRLTSFQGLNDLLRLQNHITRHKTSVEKSGNFCYNARYKVLVHQSLLALRCIRKCQSARSQRPVKELPLHIVRTLCLVLVSLLQSARKMRWHLLNLPTICSSRKKWPRQNRRGRTMHFRIQTSYIWMALS